jgi:hypothetical protein
MSVNSFFGKLVLVFTCAVVAPACDQAGKSHNEYQPRWQKFIDSNPLDGTREIQMMVGDVNRSRTQESPEILVLTCTQGVTNAYVVWRRYLGVFDPEVTWQVGSNPSVIETWALSTDNEATFAPEPVKLIKHMMGNDVFLVKTTPPGEAPVTMEFNTAGLIIEITELRETCGW